MTAFLLVVTLLSMVFLTLAERDEKRQLLLQPSTSSSTWLLAPSIPVLGRGGGTEDLGDA